MVLAAGDVRRLARLARISLDDDEVERLRDDLSACLDHFRVLADIDTEGVPPTAHVVALGSVERDDAVAPSLAPEDVLSRAPRREGAYLRVRPVLEAE
ncbi:MAG: Asp-tRNA(Asn)/Glu-tRNA(Gln) amidotransferase subunit GatC [Chloroflexi bacterium]|nr:Asp-tRNA(Asn)/Glu-tRNA(Gln) amidotransferase subunit GatC [Chloroflexota bacterium]